MSAAKNSWIFLRGLTRESRHWGAFPDTFRREIPDAQVLALDLPGNGRLHGMASPPSVEAMAAYCRAELVRRGVPPPYHLLAMSLGAMIAVAWAASHPEELRGCVLINTSLRPFSPFYRRLRPCNYPTLLKLALLGGSADEREGTILRLTSKGARQAGDRTADILRQWIAYRSQHPVSRPNAIRQLLAAARYRAPLAKPATRLLILSSAGDALVDSRCSRQLARHWHADLAEHPSAGHDLPLDDGPWVARQVRHWLQA